MAHNYISRKREIYIRLLFLGYRFFQTFYVFMCNIKSSLIYLAANSYSKHFSQLLIFKAIIDKQFKHFFFFLFLPFFCAMIPLYSFTPFLYTHHALSAFCKYSLFLDNYIPFVEEYNFNSLNIFLHFVNSLYFPFTGAYAHPSADTESECPSYQIPV